MCAVKKRKVRKQTNLNAEGRYLHRVELVVDSVSWLWMLPTKQKKGSITTKGRRKTDTRATKFLCPCVTGGGDEK